MHERDKNWDQGSLARSVPDQLATKWTRSHAQFARRSSAYNNAAHDTENVQRQMQTVEKLGPTLASIATDSPETVPLDQVRYSCHVA